MIARVGAELLRQVAHFRAPQHHIERPIERSARAGENTIHQLLLLGRHGVVGERLEAAAAKMRFAIGRGLGVHNAQHSESNGDNAAAHGGPFVR